MRVVLLAALVSGLLSSAPAWASVRVVSELTSVFEVEPGATYEGSVLLENPGDRVETVRVYQTDYWFNADGQNRFDEPGSSERSNADWVELGLSEVSIPPRQRMTVAYRVVVPDDESLNGTYWSLIMVEPVTAEAAAGGEDQFAIRQTIRYAVQVVSHIRTAPGEVAIEFANPRLSQEQGKYVLQVDIVNRGRRWFVANVWTELYRSDGTSVGRFASDRRRTYPGTSARWRMEIGELPPGTYEAIVIADGGGDEVFGAQYTLQVLE